MIDLGPYRAQPWRHAQRLILVIVDRPDPQSGQLQLEPDYFFLVTNWREVERTGQQVLEHYLDEAERCGRVGYVHLSKLLVVGTPDELKSLPNVTPEGKKRVEIVGPDIFGQAIRALINQDDPLADIAAPGIDIRPAQPNLEDVFVTLAKNQKNAA